MTLLAHISDIHFGHEDALIVEGLLESLRKTKPDVIVVSGDLTQRAKKAQFRKARAFLREMPKVPHLVVPGNHDVSATNLLERLTRPLKRYQRFITEDLSPYLDMGDVAIAGINTVRLLNRKDGRINQGQVKTACEQLGRAKENAVRVVVTHHPMDLPMEDLKHPLVSRSKMAMEAFSKCGVDLFLSGHLHTGQSLVTTTRYKENVSYSAVVAQAGTAVSTRTRGEANGWNLIELSGRADGAEMAIQEMVWEGKSFGKGQISRFRCGSGGWLEA
ncbi:metallophosphoesterase family protein [Granulicella sibirica]|uniref:3',5'-cyclic-nucleotide phosphodiesterase n=1 Tax=Granulicella sibirica TaxID=2479048 RepID=A0A4V1L6C8_9BACT|nr:metallophosphoesterase [Granulicella sibirica]RXH58814.1 3',5'-cyclic-nucleotide phosphodiesterase [Granulicella sibirica]